jgi:hypothetical protein
LPRLPEHSRSRGSYRSENWLRTLVRVVLVRLLVERVVACVEDAIAVSVRRV